MTLNHTLKRAVIKLDGFDSELLFHKWKRQFQTLYLTNRILLGFLGEKSTLVKGLFLFQILLWSNDVATLTGDFSVCSWCG